MGDSLESFPRGLKGFKRSKTDHDILEGVLRDTITPSFVRKMTKKLPLELKQTRKPIQTACGFCHEKHLQCDVGRPCQNCLKRNIGYLCRDKIRKPRKRSCTSASNNELVKAVKVDAGSVQKTGESALGSDEPLDDAASDMMDMKTEENEDDSAKTSDEALPRMHSFSTLLNNHFNTFLHDPVIPNMLGSHPETKGPHHESNKIEDAIDFGSMWATNEYMKLNDIAGIMPSDDKRPEDMVDKEPTDDIPPINRSSSSQLFQYLNVGPTVPRSDSRPFISLEMDKMGSMNRIDVAKTDQLYNADSSNPSPQNLRETELTPYKIRQLIKTPKDLFEKQHLIKPHNYRTAYKDLLRCLHRMFLGSYASDSLESFQGDTEQNQKMQLRRKQLRHIARSIVDRYAPIFVTLTSNMIEDDLLMQELILQRTLLEFENMAKLVTCTPICIWRRSGEICFVSNEFLSLTGFSKKEILNERRFIAEFLDHQSVVDYYDLFHEYLAFGSKNGTKSTTADGQAIFGECNLLVSNGSFLKCAGCWTAKRDSFNISLLVVGQFLPIFDVE
ncbi:hypothetical protein HG536_0F01330 [Torulaspora globosa]|uniref:Glucose starvation modulator protein 1 n=1 Tax=Torulaspora globosa TaxID=48254 RepID=A0A7G3ZJX2_9SACH|nr:uncharacterized protein HG536_0F01330 [Torulaspora globosa]QLL33808.1 hypothetical protein HG536_0F01330 [Torulaspora globosa]